MPTWFNIVCPVNEIKRFVVDKTCISKYHVRRTGAGAKYVEAMISVRYVVSMYMSVYPVTLPRHRFPCFLWPRPLSAEL